ncbi:MAG TPA: hypothetical protein VFC74_10020, partial [Oscillospiraceae bacterium]|nr:hypothetical protein [Oscillospiraceae bacterium]
MTIFYDILWLKCLMMVSGGEALTEPLLRIALRSKEVGAKEVFIPLHLNEYLSPKQYNEFYWPTLKE